MNQKTCSITDSVATTELYFNICHHCNLWLSTKVSSSYSFRSKKYCSGRFRTITIFKMHQVLFIYSFIWQISILSFKKKLHLLDKNDALANYWSQGFLKLNKIYAVSLPLYSSMIKQISLIFIGSFRYANSFYLRPQIVFAFIKHVNWVNCKQFWKATVLCNSFTWADCKFNDYLQNMQEIALWGF